MRLSKPIHVLCLVIVGVFSSCMTITPIIKPIKYYSPRHSAQLVDFIPKGTVFIGSAKVVPGDNALSTSDRRKQRAIQRLLEEAAKAGADFVVITDIQRSNKDYLLDWNFSDGYTIEGEMFRRIE